MKTNRIILAFALLLSPILRAAETINPNGTISPAGIHDIADLVVSGNGVTFIGTPGKTIWRGVMRTAM